MRKLIWTISMLCCVVMLVGIAQGAEKVKPAEYADSPVDFTFGGDFRWRDVYFDNIPIVADPPGVTRGGANHFFRYRTRLWGGVQVEDNFAVKGRLVNEFRHFEHGQTRSWDAWDELVVDQLYIEAKGLFNDTFDLRLGRQDLIYGTGKVLLEGTPKDGSRTIYCDAVKLVYKGIEDTTVDILGIYNGPENELALSRQDRDLTGWDPAYNDLTESGGAIYLKNKTSEDMPFEAYYFYKHESDWENRAGTTMPSADVNTFGARFMPKYAPFSMNIELAGQFGERGDEDQTGYMLDAAITDHLDGEMKPCVSLGLYCLSGDDPNTAKDEGWNPLWARWPQYSELYVYAFDAEGAGRWSNVNMPHIDFSLAPTDWLKTKLLVGYMFAPEKNGPGGGSERGFLATLRNDFTIKEGLFAEKDTVKGHIVLEFLDPGNYYNEDDIAGFARLELSYAFK